MTRDVDPGASVRRLLRYSAALVLPVVALSLGAPRLLKLARSGGGPAGIPVALSGERPGEPEPPPRPPEHATPEQIEAARAAQVAFGKAQQGWEKAAVIAPREGLTGDGVETVPFDGFAIAVDSAPEGAKVLAGGAPLGETPLMTGIACAPGTELKLRVEKAPFPARDVVVRCGERTLVKITVALGPDRPKTAGTPPGR